SHRATWRIQNRRGSNRRWMKVQWQVMASRVGPVVFRQGRAKSNAKASTVDRVDFVPRFYLHLRVHSHLLYQIHFSELINSFNDFSID
ncbi:hypothetical protein AB9E30_33900, partial [Rhizobium leguminosarum]